MKKFKGFIFPEKNYYQFPKDLNGYMDILSGNEFKVLAYIVRKTWGFNKVEDKISYSQFLNGIVNKDGIKIFSGLGISEDTLARSLNKLKEKGFIDITGTGQGRRKIKCYRLKYSKTPQNQDLNKTPQNFEKSPQNSEKNPAKLGATIEDNNIRYYNNNKNKNLLEKYGIPKAKDVLKEKFRTH